MKQERHFENIRGRSAGEAERVGTVIEDLRRIVQALDCDVAAETERSRVRRAFRYPVYHAREYAGHKA